MPIMLFNPPCPHADPVRGGIAQQTGQKCGNCVCVPRYYQINPAASGSQSAYAAAFMGPRVLTRNLQQFRRDDNELCHWDCGVTVAGLLVNGNSITPAGWSLYCAATPFTGFGSGWILRAVGQSYVGGAPPQDTAYYTLQAPGHGVTDLDCLNPNLFWLDSNYGSTQSLVNFPASILLKPFWP